MLHDMRRYTQWIRGLMVFSYLKHFQFYSEGPLSPTEPHPKELAGTVHSKDNLQQVARQHHASEFCAE